jgi:hypothetical protein
VILPDVPAWLGLAIQALGIAVQLAIAVVALLRFRATATGLILSSVALFSALSTTVLMTLHLTIPRGGPAGSPWSHAANLAYSAACVLLSLVLALGVGLIPASLRRLKSGTKSGSPCAPAAAAGTQWQGGS